MIICKTLILTGDFNIDWIDKNNYYTKKIRECFELLGYKQLISEYTRVTQNSKTLIDYVVSNDFSMKCEVRFSPKITDHHILNLNIRLTDITSKDSVSNKMVVTHKLNHDILNDKFYYL